MFESKTSTELWYELLKEGQENARITLTEIEESHSVFMLQRFIRRTDFGSIPFALQYLEQVLSWGKIERQRILSDVGDACLIMAGFFPERAKRVNVSSSYFMDLSQTCYQEHAELSAYMKRKGEAALYQEVGKSVPKIAHVLNASKNKVCQELSSLTTGRRNSSVSKRTPLQSPMSP